MLTLIHLLTDTGHPSHVTVLIGLAIGGVPVGGIIHRPFPIATPTAIMSITTACGLLGNRVCLFDANEQLLSHSFGTLSCPRGQATDETSAQDAGHTPGDVSNLCIATTRSHSTPALTRALEALKPKVR